MRHLLIKLRGEEHNERVDARIVKTRQSLQEALFELVNENGIDHISVADIAQRAGVNRSTFYLHYSDKETLLADALELVAARAGARLERFEIRGDEPPAALTDFLVHVDTYADLYRRIFTEPGYGIVLARLREQTISAIERIAPEASTGDADRPPLEFVAAGIAGAVIGMLGAWLDAEPRAAPDAAARWVWTLIPLPPDPAAP
jgi:AcrR family transcriptional regulator